MTQIYSDGTYLSHNPSWHERDSAWKATQIVRMMQRNDLRPRTICEIGCGAGEILSQLASHFNDPAISYTGFEVSPQAFELSKRKEKSNVRFLLEDILADDDRKWGSYDVALVIDVIEHVEDYFSFLRKAKEKASLKILHIPLDLSVQSVLRVSPILTLRKSVGHIHSFMKETALETLKDTGYEILDHFYTAGDVELPDKGWKAALARWPRRAAFSLNEDLAVRLLGGFSLLVLAR